MATQTIYTHADDMVAEATMQEGGTRVFTIRAEPHLDENDKVLPHGGAQMSVTFFIHPHDDELLFAFAESLREAAWELEGMAAEGV